MSYLIERVALTDEEIDALVLQEFPGFPIHDESQYARGLARIMVDAATEKAVGVVLEELEPLVKALYAEVDFHSPSAGSWAEGSISRKLLDANKAALAHYADLKAELETDNG